MLRLSLLALLGLLADGRGWGCCRHMAHGTCRGRDRGYVAVPGIRGPRHFRKCCPRVCGLYEARNELTSSGITAHLPRPCTTHPTTRMAARRPLWARCFCCSLRCTAACQRYLYNNSLPTPHSSVGLHVLHTRRRLPSSGVTRRRRPWRRRQSGGGRRWRSGAESGWRSRWGNNRGAAKQLNRKQWWGVAQRGRTCVARGDEQGRVVGLGA